ncbi:TetR family transcriptional regulator [Gordonia sp. GN26]
MTFQRARSEEQREIRRRAILDTTAAMLDEMPVADVTLNELSRRVGLAKSNVLRYFESREAVLLELLDASMASWLDELADELATGVTPASPMDARAHQVADIIGRTLATRTVLCDLIGAQGGVLERNVSVDVVKRHKRASLGKLAATVDLLRRYLPELGDNAPQLCLMIFFSAGALKTYVPPPPSVLAAYADEPELGVFNMDLREALRMSVAASLLGVLPRDSPTR